MSLHPRLYLPLSTLLPELAEMLPQDAAASAVVPEQGQLRLWETVLALLGAISRRTPLLLVLDDLHWADTSSQHLLAYLARRLHSYPILSCCWGRTVRAKYSLLTPCACCSLRSNENRSSPCLLFLRSPISI